MNKNNTLKDVGLSEGEIKVYLALLKLGAVPVNRIKEETGLHRTTIYDFLEKLINKGLVSYVIENNVKIYKATKPTKLLEFLKEKEERLKEVLPELLALSKSEKEEISVEVYRGKEGFKTFYNDVLKTKEDVVGFGVDEGKFKEKFPIIMEQYFKRAKEANIHERALAEEGSKFLFEKGITRYRFISKEFFNPTPTSVYGDKVAIIIWKPLTVIMIKNKDLADSYKKYFELLWRVAKK